MSFLARLWQRLRTPVPYVGRDLDGNRFYEHPSSTSDPRRTKRTVQYYDPEAVWQYIGGGRKLAVQWSAWLTHTRPHPPTVQELQMDLARQHRVLANVALIEARDQEERAQMLRLNAAASAPAAPVASNTVTTEGVKSPPPDEPLQASTDSQSSSPDTAARSNRQHDGLRIPSSSEPYAPQSWAPRVRRRGGEN